uniref:TAXi_C domain-containing protein n=1 Tax=Heterorhabditis bacteriophora TaxID=37862 RepID=A0A1I7WLK3_HETBA
MDVGSNTSMKKVDVKLYDAYAKMDTDFKSLYNPPDLGPVFSTGSPLKTSSTFITRQIAPGVSTIFVNLNFAYYC